MDEAGTVEQMNVNDNDLITIMYLLNLKPR